MGLFGRGDDADSDEAASLERVQAGGIPPRAQARLGALSRDGSLFTSGLSVNEFALLGRVGPRPLAQVMGASVVRPGWQYLPALDPGKMFFSGSPYAPTATGSALQNRYTDASLAQVRNYRWHADVVCELEVLTSAWNLVRRRALDRLREDALLVGADAVVGVRLHRSDHDLGKGVIEYMVVGTAIRLPGSAGSPDPTLTDLSVQDYWRLETGGHQPVGFLATTMVVFASPSQSTRMQRLRSRRQNQELDELSRAFHAARDTVRARLVGQVSDVRGVGAVGVELSHSVHREKFALASSLTGEGQRGWHRGRFGLPYRVTGRGDVERTGWVITMHAAGTAIRVRRDAPNHTVKPTVRIGSS